MCVAFGFHKLFVLLIWIVEMICYIILHSLLITEQNIYVYYMDKLAELIRQLVWIGKIFCTIFSMILFRVSKILSLND